MKLIPIYAWNKTRKVFREKGSKLSNQPWFQGALLLLCVVVALLLANLPATKEFYHNILNTELTIKLASPNDAINVYFPKDMNVGKFINDILMVIFFFTVGLEIKREVAYGELSSPKKAMLPVIAAFGGVICPALIFTLVNHGGPGATGWGIPTATDIAFAVCILSALGDKVPVAMKVFLTALAIADDLIAILVVALFYGGAINGKLLLAAFLLIGLALLMRKLGEKRMFPYLVIALGIWILFYYGGIHATMSGVVMAFVIPNKSRYDKKEVYTRIQDSWDNFLKYDDIESGMGFPSGPQRHYLRVIKSTANGSVNMSYTLERVLSPWVNYLIMPLFALANAGVELDPSALTAGGVGLGIILGLVIGKPVGITLLSWICVKLGIGEKPQGTTWPMFLAVACLGGIGFTMSIFVDTLSFGDQIPAVTEQLRATGKIAVLTGSVCAAIIGSAFVCLVNAIQKRSKK
jgi:Na+:H+ antiporter, NhaA family